MNNSVRLAYFTDFSKSSSVTFETLLFNVWSFDFQLDLIHLLKDNNDADDALTLLHSLKEEVENSMEEKAIISINLFYEDEEQKMIDFINRQNYFLTYLPVPSLSLHNGLRTFSHNLYSKINSDTTFVPEQHEVKIENKGIMMLDLDNLVNLYALKKYQEYFLFHYAKLKFIILSDKPLPHEEMQEAHNFISKTLPRVNFEVISYLKDGCRKELQKEVNESKIDFFIYSTDDTIDRMITECINTSKRETEATFSFMRLSVTPELLEQAITNSCNFEKLRLKDYSACLVS